MSLNDDIAALAQVPLLSPLDDEQLRILAFACESVRLDEGQELFRKGANADSAFIVRSGTVAVETQAGRPADVFGRDSVLDELALIATTTRPGTATAVEGPATLLRLSRNTLRRVLEEYPGLARAMHDILRDRLATMTARIGAIGDRFED